MHYNICKTCGNKYYYKGINNECIICIEKKNIIIAAFEGRLFYGKHTIDKYGDGTYNAIPDMEYHTSWDWLMPVVKKIFTIDTGALDTYSLYVSDSLRTADIKQVYEAVYDFIVWHNQQVSLGIISIKD